MELWRSPNKQQDWPKNAHNVSLFPEYFEVTRGLKKLRYKNQSWEEGGGWPSTVFRFMPQLYFLLYFQSTKLTLVALCTLQTVQSKSPRESHQEVKSFKPPTLSPVTKTISSLERMHGGWEDSLGGQVLGAQACEPAGDPQDSGEAETGCGELIQQSIASSASVLGEHRSHHTHTHTHTQAHLVEGTISIYMHTFIHSSIFFSPPPFSFQGLYSNYSEIW